VHLVLYLGVQIIGIAQIEFKNSDLCVLRTLAIDFTLQHQGYGTHLLQLLEKWIKTKHIKMIYLNTDTHTIPFYKKLGYHETTFEDPDGLNLEDKTSLSKVL
jgi:N-acetylglutamate synthase-like GNAT family acetyltransferase